MGLAQHRHPQQMMRLDHEQTGALSAEQEEKLMGYIRAEMPGCGGVSGGLQQGAVECGVLPEDYWVGAGAEEAGAD